MSVWCLLTVNCMLIAWSGSRHPSRYFFSCFHRRISNFQAGGFLLDVTAALEMVLPPDDPHWPCRPTQGLLGCFGLTEKLAGVNSPVLCTASVQGLEMRERWAESLTYVWWCWWYLTSDNFLGRLQQQVSQVPLLGFLLPYQRVGDALAGSFFAISLRIPFHLFICLQDVCKMPWNAFLHLYSRTSLWFVSHRYLCWMPCPSCLVMGFIVISVSQMWCLLSFVLQLPDFGLSSRFPFSLSFVPAVVQVS